MTFPESSVLIGAIEPEYNHNEQSEYLQKDTLNLHDASVCCNHCANKIADVHKIVMRIAEIVESVKDVDIDNAKTNPMVGMILKNLMTGFKK